MADQPIPTSGSAPRGWYTGHVDERGRLKLPVILQEWLKPTGESFWATSVDDRIARLYPIKAWEHNEKVLEEMATVDPDLAEALINRSNHYGEETKIDGQGRITLPTVLRRALALENQQVQLQWRDEAVDILSAAEYEARQRKAQETIAARLKYAKLKGFK